MNDPKTRTAKTTNPQRGNNPAHQAQEAGRCDHVQQVRRHGNDDDKIRRIHSQRPHYGRHDHREERLRPMLEAWHLVAYVAGVAAG